MKKSLILALACVLTPAVMHADTTNLLMNPGAEAGSIAGWTPTGGTFPGVDTGTFDPGINPHSGTYSFYGVNGPVGTLSQTVSVFTQGITAAMVNSGTLSANFSFWEQGLNQGDSSDHGVVSITFLDNGTTLSTFSDTVDSHGGMWTEGTGGGLIPVGTTDITYTMQFVRVVGTDNDSFIDDNSLIISTQASTGPGTTPSPVPEPGTLALLGTGLVGLAGAVRRKLTA